MNFFDAIDVCMNLSGSSVVKCLVSWMRQFNINQTTLLFTKDHYTNNVSIIHYYTYKDDMTSGPISFQDIRAAIKEAAERTFDVTAANGRVMMFMWTYTEDFTERSLWWYNSNKDVWTHADDMLTKLFEDNRDIAMDYIEEHC